MDQTSSLYSEKERLMKKKSLKRLLMVQAKQILIKIFYHIRYKYYQLQNFIKHFPLGKEEEDRLQLIDSIDKLIKSDWDRKSKERI